MVLRPKEIVEAFADYFKNLHEDPETNFKEAETQTFLKKIKLPTLTKEEASETIKPISLA